MDNQQQQRQGCRECHELRQHKQDCSLNRWMSYRTLVLDSERATAQPEQGADVPESEYTLEQIRAMVNTPLLPAHLADYYGAVKQLYAVLTERANRPTAPEVEAAETGTASLDAEATARKIVTEWHNGYRYLARFDTEGTCATDLINSIAKALAATREVEAGVWRAAILLVDTAPLCHCAGKQYIDPVALVQRMNAALEAAAKGEGAMKCMSIPANLTWEEWRDLAKRQLKAAQQNMSKANTTEDELTPTAVLQWLDGQRLMYASWSVEGLRLRLLYLPRQGRWEVWHGPTTKLYGGDDLAEACRVFKRKANQ